VPAAQFDQVLAMIDAARIHAVAAVNTTLIDLLLVNRGIHCKEDCRDGWGKGTVTALADYIRSRLPNARGFSAQNLWRMRQFFDTYQSNPNSSPLLRELPWTHNLLILAATKREEEREFYIRTARDQKWSSRELERQLSGLCSSGSSWRRQNSQHR